MLSNAPPTYDGQHTFSVIRAIYDACRRAGHSLDVLALEKLAYLSHGWSLACTGRALITEPFVVESYGPVLISLTRLRRIYGRSTLPAHEGDRVFGGTCVPFGDPIAQFEVIARVVDRYGSYESWKLSAITRLAGGAHARALIAGAATLDDAAIRADFIALAHPGRAAI